MPSYYYTKFQKNPCVGRNERCPKNIFTYVHGLYWTWVHLGLVEGPYQTLPCWEAPGRGPGVAWNHPSHHNWPIIRLKMRPEQCSHSLVHMTESIVISVNYMRFFFFFFIWVLWPFQEYYISLISSQLFITGGQKPENPKKNHLTIHKQNFAFPHVTQAGLEPQRWET